MAQGTFIYSGAVMSAITEGKYTSEPFAKMNNDARAQAIEVARAAEMAGQSQYMDILKASAAGIQASVDLRGNLAGNPDGTRQIEELLSIPHSDTP